MLKNKVVKTSLSLLMGCALMTMSSQAEERPERGKGGKGGRGGSKGAMMAGMMLLKKLDKNGDNELSSAEINSSSSVIRGMDKNGDGKVTAEELGAGMPAGAGAQSGKGGILSDQNGDGKITADDLPEKVRSRFSTMDVNGDGELDANEKALVESKFKDKMGEMAGKKRKDPLEGAVKPVRPE